MGLIVSALTALTGTGAAGIYAFGFVGLLVLIVFLHWTEIRSRLADGLSTSSPRTDDRHPRTDHRHDPARPS